MSFQHPAEGAAIAPAGEPLLETPGRPLGMLKRGDQAEVLAVSEQGLTTTLPAGELERRLLEMGFVEGARVAILHEGFLGGDPIAVRVNDHTVALRRREANAILVNHLP